jgi:predicted small secreted protein
MIRSACFWENNAGGMEPFRVLRRSLALSQLEDVMIQKIATITLFGLALGTAACNTVRGAARDVNSVANCTQNAVDPGSKHC